MSDIKHSTNVVIADDGVSAVGSDEWNATHAVSIPDTGTATDAQRVVLTGSSRLTAAGSGRETVQTPVNGFRGVYGLGSLSIYDDTYLLQYKRARLADTARATVVGTGELFIFDLAPVGRLVLAGRGGN